ncbi:hypothetical protein DM01DRAFT_1329489 [Hesseltinella vesiculosa]|uniref:Uncharacterized protein n=1 Tax=Hesseltinella vesiculosa TaxID=101127 RepID=A0A1X2G3L9_9FUNG|nr:hypothetical protein DM01DRAFT_1329489 [Hesseltinella vesiculosa]
MDYFKKTHVRYWDVSEAVEFVLAANPEATSSQVVSLIKNSLMTLSRNKDQMARASQLWISKWEDKSSKIKEMAANRLRMKTNTHVIPSSSKTADTWNSFGKVQQTNNTNVYTSQDDQNIENLHIKRGKKMFDFSPPTLHPSVSNDKARVDPDDQAMLSGMFVIKISDRRFPGVPDEIKQAYETNMIEQAGLQSIKIHTYALDFLKNALGQALADLPVWLWTHGNEAEEMDKSMIKVMRLVLTDFSANCEAPTFPGPTNERTPFVESVVPIFKYFCAATQLLTFAWCEKGLDSQKALAICTGHDYSRKLLDGIGISTLGRSERTLMESSGDVDGDHTLDDTLKLMECGQTVMKFEMNKNRQASYKTFLRRRVLGIQFVGSKLTLLSIQILSCGKWACLVERSALVPRRWDERKHWLQVFELLAKMKCILEEQDAVTEALNNEQTGWETIPIEESIRMKMLQ